MADRVDVAVVGGGMGGYVGAIRAAQLGMRVALVEEDRLGGTCLQRGCIPTKALLQTAALVDQLAEAGRLGVAVQQVSVDWVAAQRTKQAVVDRLTRGVEGLMRKHRIEVVAGRGRLAGPGRVRVTSADGDSELAAGHVVLATGSRPRALQGVDVDGRSVLSSDEALVLDHVPRSALVLGAGAIGVEFASLYRSLGAEVTLVEALERLVPLEDAAVGDALRKRFEQRGIRCLPGHRLDTASLAHSEGGVAATVTDGTREERLQAEVLLVAVGRSANLEDIGIEGTAVAVERGTVQADGMLRTGEAGVSAVGDIVGGFWLAHKAAHEGIVCAEAIAGVETHPVESRLVPRTTYCSPQIASVGLSEAEARDRGLDVRVGTFPFAANGRALIWGEPGGLCKVVSDAATNDVIGVHLVGPEVTELIAGPALAMLLEVTPFEMARAIAPHPTLSEVLGEAALQLRGEGIHL